MAISSSLLFHVRLSVRVENNDTGRRRRLTAIFLAFQKWERGKKTEEGEKRERESEREGAVSGQIMTDRLEARKKEEFKFTAVSGVR